MFKCTQCQAVQPAPPPPYNVPPSSCSSCGGAITQIGDTTPAPPGDAPPSSSATPELKAPPTGMTAEEAAAWGATGQLPARFDPAAPAVLEPATTESKPLELLKRGELKPSGPRVFFSTMLYGLARELGHVDAVTELSIQVEKVAADRITGPEPELAVAYTIAGALKLFDVTLLVDGGATSLGKARSRAAHAFMASGCEVWVSCDDDVEATPETVAALVEAVGGGAPSICIAPCLLRARPVANVRFPTAPVQRTLPSGAKLAQALAGGFGLVAVSREALHRVAADTDHFRDDDGENKKALFHEMIVSGGPAADVWLGEDLSFFARVLASVRIEALLTGRTVHDGQALELADLLPLVQKVQKSDQKQDAPAALQAGEKV